MAKVKHLHSQWRKDPAYKAAYDALAGEFDLAKTLLETRTRAGLSQSAVAARMRTSQSYVARIEGGQVSPSTEVLERFALATGTRLRIAFDPHPGGARGAVLARLKG